MEALPLAQLADVVQASPPLRERLEQLRVDREREKRKTQDDRESSI